MRHWSVKDHFFKILPVDQCWAQYLVEPRTLWAFMVIFRALDWFHKIPTSIHCYWVLVFFTLLSLPTLHVQDSKIQESRSSLLNP